MKINQKKLTKKDNVTFETQIKFKRKTVNIELTNEESTIEDTIILANKILKDLKDYDVKARETILDAHEPLQKGEKLVLNFINFSEKNNASFAYSFIERSGFPGHTFFVETSNGGDSFDY